MIAMGEWGWFAVVLFGTVVVCLLVVAFFSRRQGPERLRSDDRADLDSHPELVLGDMTDVLSQGLPGSGRDREEILPELIRAGMYGRTALDEYRAVRAVLILIPLFAAAAIALLIDEKYIPRVALGGVIFAALGYSLPRVYVSMRAQKRLREVERGLPVFADMLSIALLAGQGLTGALRRVTYQLRNSFPKMTEELEIVLRQTEMLNLHTACEQWANRSGSTDVRNLSVILGQTQRLGNDVTTALMEYSTNLRSGARYKADARAQRAGFWMLFPTILCLWIPAAILLVAPVYFEFGARRAKAREQIQKTGPGTDFNRIISGKQRMTGNSGFKEDGAPSEINK